MKNSYFFRLSKTCEVKEENCFFFLTKQFLALRPKELSSFALWYYHLVVNSMMASDIEIYKIRVKDFWQTLQKKNAIECKPGIFVIVVAGDCLESVF